MQVNFEHRQNLLQQLIVPNTLQRAFTTAIWLHLAETSREEAIFPVGNIRQTTRQAHNRNTVIKIEQNLTVESVRLLQANQCHHRRHSVAGNRSDRTERDALDDVMMTTLLVSHGRYEGLMLGQRVDEHREKDQLKDESVDEY